jgi:hypothetical protein
MQNKISHKSGQKLIEALSRARDDAKFSFKSTHKKAITWLDKNEVDIGKIRQRSAKLLAGASLTGTLLLSPPTQATLSPAETKERLADAGYVGTGQIESRLASEIKELLPQKSGHATQENEDKISEVVEKELGIKAVPQYEGQRLNHTIGYMGYEQHLKRFPGDTIYNHDEQQQAGIAPGLGAWGYFTTSKSDMTREDELKEKYYFAVQTLYLPNWNTQHRTLVPWYKHRKMIAINPETGKAVVGVVADAGPADWTGKHFGGSPEIMTHLGLVTGKKKGRVMLYFVDDPDNSIPLGPVRVNYQLAKVEEV